MSNTATTIVVREGVPLPESRQGRHFGRKAGSYGPVRTALTEMKIGQSIVFKGDVNEERKRISPTLHAIHKATGQKYATRIEDLEGGARQLAVWRTA